MGSQKRGNFVQEFEAVAYTLEDGEISEIVESEFGYILYDNRLFTIPALLLLISLMVTKGADLGMKALYVVVAILAVSLVLFFMGSTPYNDVFDSSLLFKK